MENFDRIAPVAAITEESGSYVLVSGPSSPDTRINLEDGDGNSVLVIDKWRESRSFLAVLDLQDGTPLFLKEMVQTGNIGSIQMMTVLPNKEALTILVVRKDCNKAVTVFLLAGWICQRIRSLL